ncbi:hypothetical protein EPYR_02710 [Erwinia pyrifoliae DSM 12163]|nr:hypothetical protein EPYR_02710 [Erwinia pyrifoliae DSM 12163]
MTNLTLLNEIKVFFTKINNNKNGAAHFFLLVFK